MANKNKNLWEVQLKELRSELKKSYNKRFSVTSGSGEVLKRLQDFNQFKLHFDELELDDQELFLLIELLHSYPLNDEMKTFLNYLTKHPPIGWWERKYERAPDAHNRDIRGNCRELRNHYSSESGSKILEIINKIFLDKDYGEITTLIFSYCLSSVFTTWLKVRKHFMDNFLQISYKSSSNVRRLLLNIVDICDINVGFHEYCAAYEQQPQFSSCTYKNRPMFPMSNIDDNMSIIEGYKDVPFIIDAATNDRRDYYDIIIRKISNMTLSQRKMSFNAFPIFTTHEIRTGYDNFINLDIPGLSISDEYMDLIESNRHILGSLVFMLIQSDVSCNNIQSDIKNLRHDCRIMGNDIARQIAIMTNFSDALLSAFDTWSNNRFQRDIADLKLQMRKMIASQVRLRSPDMPVAARVLIEFSDDISEKLPEKSYIDLVREIESCFNAFAVSITTNKVRVLKDRIIIEFDTVKNTKISDVKDKVCDVSRRLHLEHMIIDDSSKRVSKMIVSKDKILSPKLLATLKKYKPAKGQAIPCILGYDVNNDIVGHDIEGMPHLLIGGSTGSGKTILLYSIINSLITYSNSETVRLFMVDVSSFLTKYNNIPHMEAPVITDISQTVSLFLYLQRLMEGRYDRKFSFYPSIVCIIDEFEVLFKKLDKKNIEMIYKIISDLLSRGRQAHIHLIFATQDPSSKTIGKRLSNFQARICLRTDDHYQSKAVIGSGGGENLMGKGDMLYKGTGVSGLMRLQGAYISESDLESFIDSMQISDPYSKLQPSFEYTTPTTINSSIIRETLQDIDILLCDILFEVLAHDHYSNNKIKGSFNVGYTVANRYCKRLQDMGIFGDQGTKRSQKVIPVNWDDLSDEAKILLNNTYTKESIVDQFAKRNIANGKR